MLSIYETSGRLCDGLTRRVALQAGGLGALGLTGWPGRILNASEPRADAPADSVILLFLLGGPPQQSTWDPKPLAPEEVRGDFGPIPTKVAGVHISELMPRMAERMDQVALLRAVSTGDNAHSSSGYYMMTGVPHVPQNRENANPGAPNDWPTMASVVQHLENGRRLNGAVPGLSPMPGSVRLPMHIFNTDGSVWPGQDSGWLGHAASPWLFRCEPASPDFDVPQFRLQSDVTLGRLENRRSLLDQLESQLREADRSDALTTYDGQERQVFELLSSKQARAACDLKQEPDAIREQYGRGQFGQSVLLARRLVEAGVKFVQVNWFRGPDEPPANPCWDSHADESNRLKNVLVPPWDQAYAALLDDLRQRGMLERTLVVCMAEFGRTPKFNARAGRDHWGHVFSVALSGGGIRGGVVHGVSDAQGGYPREGMVRPQDITATIFDRLGITPGTMLHDSVGRPMPVTRGDVIREIV